MNPPEISFIVPVYKVEYNQLKRCIESIITQESSSNKIEIILIDDGSPDDCGAICDQYQKQYLDIKVIHQANQGLSVVRNVGIENASGNWIAFVDADDWIESNTVEYALSLIKQVPDDCDIIIWDGFAEFEHSSTPICFFGTRESELLVFSGNAKEKVIDRVLPRHVKKADINRCASLGVTWARIYRRSMLVNNNIRNIPGLRLMQDSVFNLWAIEYSRTVCYQYIPLYHYSMHDDSVSKRQDETATDTVLQLYGYYSDFIRKFHNEEEYWQRLYVRTVRMLVKCLSKDYANPSNKLPLKDRVSKMRNDLNKDEFTTALTNCDLSGQDIKFQVICFLLRHKFYSLSILLSRVFSEVRK